MELSDRIKYILENNKVKPGISEYEFAKSVKTYPAKFAEIRSGKVKTLSNDIALRISKLYGYEFKWILTGEGEIIVKKTNTLAMRGDFDVDEKMKNWGERLEKIQLENKMSNKQFASLIGVGVEKYFKICATSPKPSIEILDAVVENFDVSLDWLLYGEGSPNCSSGLKD